MHEFSIACALVRLTEQHRPSGCVVRAVRVQVGPLQAIDPPVMQWAWLAATQDTAIANTQLELEMLPWRMKCRDCKRCWEADSLDVHCLCGSERSQFEGGDELLLESLETDEPRADHDGKHAP